MNTKIKSVTIVPTDANLNGKAPDVILYGSKSRRRIGVGDTLRESDGDIIAVHVPVGSVIPSVSVRL